MVDFIKRFQKSWRASEAGEAVHHQLTDHMGRNATQHGDERKLLGRKTTYQHACSFKFEKHVQQLAAGGSRRTRKLNK